MDKSYAFAAKQAALLAALVCFIVILLMIYPVLQPPQNEPQWVCGNALQEMAFSSEVKNGKTLFNHNCAQCHAKNMKDKLTGPPLGEWHNYFSNEKEVTTFLNDPKSYRKKTKNKALKAILKDYDPTECTGFPPFTEQEVASIMKYIDQTQLQHY
jgi:cytochrome c1